jgi:hypothetical protein
VDSSYGQAKTLAGLIKVWFGSLKLLQSRIDHVIFQPFSTTTAEVRESSWACRSAMTSSKTIKEKFVL